MVAQEWGENSCPRGCCDTSGCDCLQVVALVDAVGVFVAATCGRKYCYFVSDFALIDTHSRRRESKYLMAKITSF